MTKALGAMTNVQGPMTNVTQKMDTLPPGGSDAVAAGEGFFDARLLGFASELHTFF